MRLASRMALLVAIVLSAVLLLSGCGGQETVSPGLPGGAPGGGGSGAKPPQTATVVPGAKLVFALDLSKAGTPKLLAARGIASANVRGGVLEIRTATDDCNFGLFPKRREGIKPPIWLKAEMSNTVPKAFSQVYWSTGGGLSEANATRWSLPGDARMHTYTVEIKASQPVIYLRFDPTNHRETVKIAELEVYTQP